MGLSEYTLKLQTSLKDAALLPGSASPLIPRDFSPTTELHIAYQDHEVDFGNLFRARECKIAPTVAFQPEADGSPAASYLLMLVDPDAPTPDNPEFAFWRHWVLPGLQPTNGSDSSLVAETKRALTEYLGPGPKDESKPHRYLYLLFQEPAGLDVPKEELGGDEFVQRRSFDAASFVEKHSLSLVSVNWMLGAGDGWEGSEGTAVHPLTSAT